MEELFDQLKEGKGYFCHHFVHDSINLNFDKNLEFDQNLRYIVGYGQSKVFTLNFEKNELETFEIDTTIYDHIYDISFKSETDGSK